MGNLRSNRLVPQTIVASLHFQSVSFCRVLFKYRKKAFIALLWVSLVIADTQLTAGRLLSPVFFSFFTISEITHISWLSFIQSFLGNLCNCGKHFGLWTTVCLFLLKDKFDTILLCLLYYTTIDLCSLGMQTIWPIECCQVSIYFQTECALKFTHA